MAYTSIYLIILLTNLLNHADLDEKEDGEAQADEEDDEKAYNSLMVCHLFYLSVFEQQVYELVLYFYRNSLLLVCLSVRDHYKLQISEVMQIFKGLLDHYHLVERK